jgi:hypothetical protein
MWRPTPVSQSVGAAVFPCLAYYVVIFGQRQPEPQGGVPAMLVWDSLAQCIFADATVSSLGVTESAYR